MDEEEEEEEEEEYDEEEVEEVEEEVEDDEDEALRGGDPVTRLPSVYTRRTAYRVVTPCVCLNHGSGESDRPRSRSESSPRTSKPVTTRPGDGDASDACPSGITPP